MSSSLLPTPTRHHHRWTGPAALQETRWTLIRRIRGRSTENRGRHGRGDPANELCEIYSHPLYCHLRRGGLGREDAQDCVQSFWAKLFRLGTLERVDEQKGKFRSFLLTGLDRHRRGQWRAHLAIKRGGGVPTVPLGDVPEGTSGVQPAASGVEPDRHHDLAVASALVQVAVDLLRLDYVRKGKAPVFEALLPIIEGPMPHHSYAELSATLGQSQGSLRVAALRLHKHFQRLVRQVAAQSWNMPEGPALERELRMLFRTVS